MEGEAIPVLRAVDFGEAKLLPDVDRARAWLLTVDGAPQSYVDLADPEHLEFEYVRRVAYVVEAVCDTREAPVGIVHLGGGALTLPRRFARTVPGAVQDVVEADRGLAGLVAEYLPWDAPEIRTHVADAREWLTGRADASADVLVVDVFGGSRVPAHLTTVECATEAARVLRPGGLYVANLADAAPFAFLGSQLATVRAAFGPDAEVCVLVEPGVLRGRRYGNAVLAVSRGPLPADVVARRCAADPFPARVLGTAEAVRAFPGAPVHDAEAADSPEPPRGAFTIG
ncbi:fused MFS/spermidine synthase [Streptomyces sp. NPDC088194]|uniref:spermidine synthase n=1 Tax=Streptomyces sp. NPDC088194 TaxID=3154931 RepID=UPI00344F8BC0